MIRKSISIALCFSTVLSSISWSMELTSQDLTLRPVDAFFVENSNIQKTLTQNTSSETGRSFIKGAKDGFSSYTSGTQDFLKSIWKGELKEVSESTTRQLIQKVMGTSLKQYQQRNAEAQKRGELDADSVKEIFTLVREGIYQSLLRTGAFGSPKKVFIPERNVTETHYDVTLSASASFLNAILPTALPLRGILISLVNNSAINSFLMNQIDAQFARLTVKYFEQITGIKITQTMIGSMGLIGLSGKMIGEKVLESALTDYDNAESLPLLTQETQPSFSALWNYINPRLSHYIRQGIIESVIGIAGLTAEKISDPVGLAVARTIHNNSQFITGTIGFIGYSIGESLTSIPYLDGAIGSGVAYWASNGLLQAALPRGLDESRRKLVEMTMKTLRLTATYYVNQFMPVTRGEHQLFGLNPNPSTTELDLFRKDYEGRDALNQQSIVVALIQDLASAVSTPLSLLLEASGLTKLAAALLGSNETAEGLALLTAPQGHAQANHHDTVARIKLFELAKALDAVETQQSDFTKTAPWYSRALAYWNGEIPDQLKLTDEQQQLLDTIRKHPSFEFLKAELEHLAKHYTWLSKEDQSTKLKPYEDKRQILSAEFTQEAIAILNKIDAAKSALKSKVDHVETAMTTLMNGLSLDHFVIALDALLDSGIRDQFDFSRPITDLPGFAVALKDYSELLRYHESLVNFIQTSSLGMDKSLTEQLDLAQHLSTVEDIEQKLQASMSKPIQETIPTVESQELHTRYSQNVATYLGHVYGQVFLTELKESELTELVSKFDSVVFVESESGQHIPTEYVQKCLGIMAKDSKFGEFRTQLSQLNLDQSVKTAIYQHIIQDLIQQRIELDRKQSDTKDSSSKEQEPSSWLASLWPKSKQPTLEDKGRSSDWVLVSDEIGTASEIITHFALPELAHIPLETFESQGFEAYFIAKTIKDMIAKDPAMFKGRSHFALTKEDMLKVAQWVDDIRRSQVVLSDDLMAIDRHTNELAALVHKNHRSSVVWTYDTLLTELRTQTSDALKSVLPVSDSLESGSSDHNNDH
ncbi:MAG: hypothetical protein KF820_05795 [Candidatus Paracaedibacteraceae bacterium]|nr:hypothetical protein [Candidatus Paracaedibacteraceae bacterium]